MTYYPAKMHFIAAKDPVSTTLGDSECHMTLTGAGAGLPVAAKLHSLLSYIGFNSHKTQQLTKFTLYYVSK